jgi:hypothetical protein
MVINNTNRKIRTIFESSPIPNQRINNGMRPNGGIGSNTANGASAKATPTRVGLAAR